jgi:hypothetical protein
MNYEDFDGGQSPKPSVPFHCSALLKFMNDIKLPSLKLSDLVIGKRYYLVATRINGRVDFSEGRFVDLFRHGPELMLNFRNSELEYSGIRAIDYNLLEGQEPSSSVILEDLNEARDYQSYMQDVVKTQKITLT